MTVSACKTATHRRIRSYYEFATHKYNRRRSHFKKHVKRFYYACRRFDERLRARMNAYDVATAARRGRAGGSGAAAAEPTAVAASAPAEAKRSSLRRAQEKPAPEREIGAAGCSEPVSEAVS